MKVEDSVVLAKRVEEHVAMIPLTINEINCTLSAIVAEYEPLNGGSVGGDPGTVLALLARGVQLLNYAAEERLKFANSLTEAEIELIKAHREGAKRR